MKIERYRDQIDQLAPLVIDGSADLADVKTVELVLLVVELHERGQREAAGEACRELSARVADDEVSREIGGWVDWSGDLLKALDDEARVAG